MSESILIAEYGVEGGGETLFGRQEDGVWLFWTAGSSGGMLDDEEEDPIRQWKTEERADLASLLPDWFHFAYPMRVHPDFAEQVVALWRAACAKVGFTPDNGEANWAYAVQSWRDDQVRRNRRSES